MAAELATLLGPEPPGIQSLLLRAFAAVRDGLKSHPGGDTALGCGVLLLVPDPSDVAGLARSATGTHAAVRRSLAEWATPRMDWGTWAVFALTVNYAGHSRPVENYSVLVSAENWLDGATGYGAHIALDGTVLSVERIQIGTLLLPVPSAGATVH